MAALETLTAKQILAIPVAEPERLFSGSRDALRHEFVVLAKKWHPDHNKGAKQAAAVFERVVALREEAERKISGGAWTDPGTIRIDTLAGRSFRLKIKKRREFELGEMAIASERVAFIIGKEHDALFKAGIRRVEGIRYPDEKIRRDLSRFFPVPEVYETATNRVAIFPKTDDVVLLADLTAYLGGEMPPKHAAWVVSSLLNLACFFEVSGVTHNALSTTTVFVSPKHHAAYPLGGWWYALKAGDRLEMLPPETHDLLPPSMAAKKRADIRLDLESIRAIGRAAFGDPTGLKLVGRKDVPKTVANFLRLPSSGSAVDDYRAWMEDALPGFGPRRFLELPVTSSDVYP